MYCKKCGSELEIENQRFCQICGTEIRSYHVNSQQSLIRDSNKSSSTPPPHYQDISKRSGGPYAKRCLGFGIISLLVAVISFNIGSSIIWDNLYYSYPRDGVLIGLIIARIIGILFGIFNRLSYNRAISVEPESSILKAGNILGILGILFNSVLMLIAIFLI
ncbi:MAG: zinc-ribbon domain-containing protein [Candidatus Lokiarchaeota archaeon]|nr:zinc-ribbon domain-containing protein [Candidatus Lokiarchaeota archaeon]